LQLWYSIDFGDTWTPIWSYISGFSWADAGVTGNHDNQLYVLDWANKTGSILNMKNNEPKRLLKTTTFFRGSKTDSFTKINDDVLDFTAVGDDLFIRKRLPTGVILFTSVDGGDNWHLAKFPIGSQIEQVRRMMSLSVF
jgi:hypothetical protein